MSEWLITPSALAELRTMSAVAPTAEQLDRYSAAASSDRPPRSLTVDAESGVAVIAVTGPLFARSGFLQWLIGGTSYPDLTRALAAANTDQSVRQIRLDIDSPGGEVGGMFELIAALETSAKPVSVRAQLAASAAYAIAAAAGPITAAGPAATFGSIGVVASMYVHDRIVEVSSTKAPKKRPDVRTDAGKAVVRAYLDELHELFVSGIARGRGVTPATVNSDFGKGAVILAASALKAGMIDRIEGSTTSPKKGKARTMTPEEIRLAHPQAYAAILEAGRTEERERVVGFLDCGETAGALGRKKAVEGIRAGEQLTPAKLVTFTRLALNTRDQNDYAADSAAAEEVMADADGAPHTRDLGDILADSLGAPQLPKPAATPPAA